MSCVEHTSCKITISINNTVQYYVNLYFNANHAEHETLELSLRDRAVFFDALVKPPEPSGQLVRALAEHRRRVAS